jgi:acyl-CoA reductase-like NAD-dependent aldehyde dehydrogenase
LNANRGTGQDKAGFTLRRPCGVVVAITAFNYPAPLVLHKLAPALAAGNAVVLKPATSTPLTALALAGCFVDAGLPEGVLSVLVGSGGVLGDLLVADPRVRKVSFTGSTATGEHIELAARAVESGGCVNAGKGCISVQRVVTHPSITGDFLGHDRRGGARGAPSPCRAQDWTCSIPSPPSAIRCSITPTWFSPRI